MSCPKILATKTKLEIWIIFIWALVRPWISSNPRYYQKMMSKPIAYHKSCAYTYYIESPPEVTKNQ
jgi:hypothetical protein